MAGLVFCCAPHEVGLPDAGSNAIWDGTGYLPVCDDCLVLALEWVIADAEAGA